MNKKGFLMLLMVFGIGLCKLSAQVYGEKAFYLIDSIEIDRIDTYNRALVDSILQQYHQTDQDTAKLHLLSNLVLYCWDPTIWPGYNDFLIQSTINLLSQEKSLPVKTVAKKYLATGFLNKVALFLEKGFPDSSLAYLNKSLVLAEEINDLPLLEASYLSFSTYYNNEGDVLRSLEYLNKCLKIAEDLEDNQGISYVYSNIADNHNDQEHFQDALDNYSKSIEYCYLTDDVRMIGTNQLKKAQIFIRLNQLDSSLFYANKSEESLTTINEASGLLKVKKVRAKIHFLKDELAESKALYLELEKESRPKNYKLFLSQVLKNLGKIEFEAGDLNKSKNYAEEAYSLSKKTKAISDQIQVSKLLLDIYIQLNLKAKAFDILNEYTILKDSVFNSENKKATIEYQFKYDYEKKKEIDELKSQQDILLSEEKAKRSNYLSLGAVAVAILVVFFFIYIYSKLKVIRNQKTELDKAYFLLEEQKKNELAASNLKAIKSQMNPHFIFNSINSIQSLVLKQDTHKSYDSLVVFSKLVRDVLSFSERGFISLDEEIKFLEAYLGLEKLRFRDDFTFELSSSVEEEEVHIPSLIVQPFVENALKHGLLHKDGAKNLTIHFEFVECFICTITDNGIGREAVAKIHERQNSAHNSFSTKAIKNRLHLLEAQTGSKSHYEIIDLKNGDGSAAGTQIVLQLPWKLSCNE